ncbi:hypothetical protein ACHAWF_018187 [Thalassiosira exigua]
MTTISAIATTKDVLRQYGIMPNSLQTLKRMLAEGQLQLGFQDLTVRDVRRILTKLNSGRPSKHPRRCAQVKETLESEVIRNISSESIVRTINFVGNTSLGDEVTECLHLLPGMVRDIDFSNCGLTIDGIKTLFEFMEDNKTITRLIMWGNNVCDMGAFYMTKMLMKNTCLQELCCYNDWVPEEEVRLDGEENEVRSNGDVNDDKITWIGMTAIAKSLEHNRTLRDLKLDLCIEEIDPYISIIFRQSLKRAGKNSAIESLTIGGFFDPILLDDWANTFKKCENLRDLGFCNSIWKSHPKLMYWRNLNKYNARHLTREGSIAEVQSTVERAAKKGKLDVVYYLLRHNAGIIWN